MIPVYSPGGWYSLKNLVSKHLLWQFVDDFLQRTTVGSGGILLGFTFYSIYFTVRIPSEHTIQEEHLEIYVTGQGTCKFIIK